jgi:hypothetical protein
MEMEVGLEPVGREPGEQLTKTLASAALKGFVINQSAIID